MFINPNLLSKECLDNLIMEFAARQGAFDSSGTGLSPSQKERALSKLANKEYVIHFSDKDADTPGEKVSIHPVDTFNLKPSQVEFAE